MNKKALLTELGKRLDELNKLVSYLENHPVMAMKGTLLVCQNARKCNIYKQTDDGEREYLGKDKQEEIQKLAKKAHYQKMLSAARKERDQIQKCIRTLNSGTGITDIDDVYPSLNKVIRRTEGPFTMTDDGYVSKWLKKNNYLRNNRELNGQYKTLKGEYVKSKSEVIIADRLTYYGVPYVYEITTAADAFVDMRYPDFLILNKRTKGEFYWEHLGKMGDPQYAARNQIKMEQFAKQGIILGKNLIVSLECGDRPLSTEYVDSVIKGLFL
jgi:hypothetical protein